MSFMLYGDEKVREIARSILPSTGRRSARINAANVKRRNRRITRQSLRDWATYEDPYEFEGHIFDYGDSAAAGKKYMCSDIKEVMWRRRDGDKFGAFFAWARATTAHMDDPVDRYNAVRRVLPDNLIGRHALGHLSGLDEFDDGEDRWWYRHLWRSVNWSPWQSVVYIRHILRELIASGYHKELNEIFYVAGFHTVDNDAQVFRSDTDRRERLQALAREANVR
jgi:hypothetical protein